MADNNKVVINLATGLEDGERVIVAFLVAGAALDAGKQVAFFLTRSRALPRARHAVAAHRSSGFSSRWRKRAASCSCVRSVSTAEGWREPSWSPTRA
jgi:hypothetical protein